jgi:hypothetical protein
MAFAAYSDSHPLVVAAHARASAPKLSGLWTRLLNAVVEARTRQAERQIAQFIELRGGALTDDVERQIERRFL